jgi:hypothetical protein
MKQLAVNILLFFVTLIVPLGGTGCPLRDPAKRKPFDIQEHTIALPSPNKPWTVKHHINIELVSLPKDWLESAVNIPFPGYKMRLHMPLGFAIDASLHTIGVASQCKIGPRFLTRWKHFHAGVGLDLNANLGWLDGYGFDNSFLRVWQIEPNAAMGFHFDNLALSIEARYRYILDYQVKTGSVGFKESQNVFNGYTLSANVEQRLVRNQVMLIGISVNYARFHVLAWPVFNPVKQQYFMPQFNIGLTF